MAKDYRRLSAIMFTDIVGYSALTQKNEELALELLKVHREILRRIFSSHNGKEIETAGDSFFVEFDSALEASRCAVEIQETLHDRNRNEPQERRILLRVGLHVGDVVHIDKHVHGDGVNLAARIEPLALPGSICISEDVERQIRNKIKYPLVKLGKQKLKNIQLPMNIYRIILPWESSGAGNNYFRRNGYTGRKNEAEELLNEFKQSNVSPGYLAIVYAGLGEKDKAINYLYESFEERQSGLIYLKVVNLFDPLRKDKRFTDLLKKIGLL